MMVTTATNRKTRSETAAGPAVPPPARRIRFVEAPDRGYQQGEAPEASVSRHAEAPDAGRGRMAALESEFTHGRSQS